MSTIEKITAKGRSEMGSTASRRLRSEGIVPANLYGHNEGAVAIKLDGESAHALIKDGAKVFDLDVDGKVDKVLLRDVQWDTFSKHIIHMDFVRVDPNERVHVEVPVILRGTAPGALEGGILEQPLHTIEIECLAVEIPDSITVRIGGLKMGESITVADLTDLPRGLVVLTAQDGVIAHIAHPSSGEPASAADSDESEGGAES